MAKKATESDAAHRQRFIETARALGCDENEQTFLKALGKIAAPKPPKDKPE